jgi:CRP-like cAMP-binding protein
MSTAPLCNDRVIAESRTSPDVPFAQMEQSPHPLIRQLARDIGPKVLESLPNPAVRRRRLVAGQVLFRDGEFTSSFYLIESGTLGLYEGGLAPIIQRRRGGWLRRCASGLRGLFGASDGDRPHSLPLGGRMVRVAGPGEVAGEMACMNFYPRTESALALEDCVVLEVAHVALDHLPVGRFREAIEALYREHAVPNALRRSNLLAPLRESPDQREAVIADLVARHAVEVVRHGPDEAIFTRGNRADGLYSIHIGHVRVSAHRPGGEATVAYAGPLEFFGEVAHLSDLLDVRTGDLPMSRVFTCRALDHVELLRIGPASLPLLPCAVRHAVVTTGLDRLRRA